MENKGPTICLSRQEKCDRIQKQIFSLWSFLDAYLPLANSQGSEFIVNGLWMRLVPKAIQDELLAMSDTQLSLLPCLKLGNEHNIEQNISFTQATSNEQHDPIHTHLPISENSCQAKMAKEIDKTLNCHHHQQRSRSSLETFVFNAQRHVLTESNLLTNHKDILDILSGNMDQSNIASKGTLMSQKKNHEVDKMSNVCSELGRSFNTNLTVDLGSGKGYLSTQLCYQYQQTVIGIDASQGNTDGANKRTDRLTKEFLTQTKGKKVVPLGEKHDVVPASVQLDTKLNTKISQPQKPAFQDISDEFLKMALQSNEVPNTSSDITCKDDKGHFPGKHHSRASEQTRVCDDSHKFQCSETNEGWNRRFVPLTKYVDCNMALLDSVGGALNELQLNPEEVNILLTGLHTCGGLGSSILKLFVNSPSVSVLCNVACCYNLLQEKECDTGYSEVYDFPMSSFLQKINVRLGKAARNIACLSVQRMATEEKLQGKAFYPRALLQKIVSDLFPDFKWEGHSLRKIDKRSKSLYDYIYRCFTKFGLATEKITPEFVESYNARFSHVERQLSAFVQLRAVLAPCIESLILLDRYLYLLQQENVAEVFLTQLFDPTISPRCCAIIATKHKPD